LNDSDGAPFTAHGAAPHRLLKFDRFVARGIHRICHFVPDQHAPWHRCVISGIRFAGVRRFLIKFERLRSRRIHRARDKKPNH
jgi:hypothetical protein